jgi:branched-chain amino acid transport system substrate-binding protein
MGGLPFAPRGICLAVALALLSSLVVACSDSPIVVGFSGPQKGKYSDLGVQGRNGVTLAIEEINAAGGVDGRELKLIIRDDASTDEGAIRADRELLDAGVDVIIGHMTSAQSLAALEVHGDDVVYISPTTSTDRIQGIKDNFFRVVPTLTDLSKNLASYAVKHQGKRRVAFIWDTSNAPFTEPYKDTFAEYFQGLGGEVVGAVPVDSKRQVDWQDVVAILEDMRPDVVVAVTAARDLAVFAQYCRLYKAPWTIMSSMWGFTQELIQTGGKSVEGIFFAVHFSEDNPHSDYEAFKERYQKRFGWEPNFAAAFGYEAVQVLAEAVRRNGGSTRGLEEIIPGMTFSSGIMGPFAIDEYGDVQRTGTIVVVRDGQFVTVDGDAQ